MATDKNGRELKVGDEVLVRATVTKIWNALEDADALIRATFNEEGLPALYIAPQTVVLATNEPVEMTPEQIGEALESGAVFILGGGSE